MSERTPTRKPMIVGGTTVISGDPNTGQILFTTGGTRLFNKFSGTAGGDAQIHTGAGRLDAVVIHPPSVRTVANGSDVNSGFPIILYDGAAQSGGPDPAVHKVIWTGHADYEPTVSGGFRKGRTVPLGYPFTSGLAFASKSGMDGFTAIYTPVLSGAGQQ